MRTFVVYHLIHVVLPHRRIAKLFIVNVPDGEDVGWDLVDEIDEFGEFNIPHANHFIAELKPSSDPSLKRAFREGGARRVTFEHLQRLSATV